jgi:outer membrane lipoprotein
MQDGYLIIKIMKKFLFCIFLFSFIFASGCGHVISKDLKAKTDPSLTFGEISKNPNTYKGKIVIWGGEVIQTLPEKDGNTLLEVLEWPLSWRGKPRRTVSLQGKFLVLVKDHLDPSPYQRGKRVTVAGEIQGSMLGEEINPATDPTYRYPLLLSKEVHVWEHRSYPYSSVPDDRQTWGYRNYEGVLRY